MEDINIEQNMLLESPEIENHSQSNYCIILPLQWEENPHLLLWHGENESK